MYKDLSLKEKAKVLQYGGKLGLTSVEDIAKLYDDAISHKFQGDTNSQMDNSSGVLKWNEELQDFVYSVPEVTVAYDLPKRNEDKSGFDRYVQSMTNSYINGNINTKDVNKLPWQYRNAVLGRAGNYKPAKYTSDQLKRKEWQDINNFERYAPTPRGKKAQFWMDTRKELNELEDKFQNYYYDNAEDYRKDLNKFEELSSRQHDYQQNMLNRQNYISNNAGKILNSYIPFFDFFDETPNSIPSQLYRYALRHGIIKDYNTNKSSEAVLSGKGTDIISLNNSVTKLTPSSQQSTGLFNEFVETKNPSIRTAKEYKSGRIRNFGDRNIPTKNVYLYQGVEEGKFKIGYIDDFQDETQVYPVRNIKKDYLSPIKNISITKNGKNGISKDYEFSLPRGVPSTIYNKIKQDLLDQDVNYQNLQKDVEDYYQYGYIRDLLKAYPDRTDRLWYNYYDAKDNGISDEKIKDIQNNMHDAEYIINLPDDEFKYIAPATSEGFGDDVSWYIDSLLNNKDSENYQKTWEIEQQEPYNTLLNLDAKQHLQFYKTRDKFVEDNPGIENDSKNGYRYLVTDVNNKTYPVSELNASILDNKMVLGNPNGGIFIGRFQDISQPQLDSLNAYLQKNPSWISRNDLGSFDQYRLDSPTLGEYLKQYYEHPDPNDPNVFVVGTTQPNKLWSNSYAKGGKLILDNNGYYAHPRYNKDGTTNDMLIEGDSTGTNITTQGIPFKIAAWDNLGNYQELDPNGEYYFPGSMVREHALTGHQAQEGKKFNRQRLSDNEYFSIMEKVAEENNSKWNEDRKKRNQRQLSVDEELVRLLNSNDYDYRGYYTKYPNSKANADTHWTDEFKTVYHPTFSEELRYSGIIDRNYNPYGYTGGSWGNNDEFIPATWQIGNQFQLGGLAKPFSYGDIPDVRYQNGGHFAQFGRTLKSLNRINRNDSSTQEQSEAYEALMRQHISGVDPQYPIPYIPDKSILINGSTTSTNVLDSIVKYAGIHNRDLKPAQNPAKANPKPRKIEPYEAIGLGIQETHLGAIPSISIERPSKATDDEWKQMQRALYNANQFTAYGDVPSYALLNNYHWLDTNGSVHPLLDAMRYYSQGDYNTGDKNHTKDVKNAGLKVWRNQNIQDWWNNSGKYVYEGKPTPEQTALVEILKADPLNYIDGVFQYDSFGNPIKALGGNLFKKGGIYIKPENRGKFTALKKRTGHSASWFKAHGTPAQKKMATFALNSKHWHHKHDEGGYLYSEGGFLLAPYLYNE